MPYTYAGIQKLSREEIITAHETNTLTGLLKLYPDNTECYIESCTWQEILTHIEKGGEIGRERKRCGETGFVV